MNIGIEINHVVRDINSQILKYFIKDIQRDFDEDSVDLKRTDFINQIPFKDEKAKNDFLFIDYPYEVFGCASTTHMHLPVLVNDWADQLHDLSNGDDFTISYFSLGEKGLSIQSTFFFLSKTASRIRDVFFPTSIDGLWDRYDVIITTNADIVKKKPKGKVAVVIKLNDNNNAVKKADLVYDWLADAVLDLNFVDKVSSILSKHKGGVFNWFKKLFK